MYGEVWNIMQCNQNVPDPNKHEQTPDAVREMPCRLSDSSKIPANRRFCRRVPMIEGGRPPQGLWPIVGFAAVCP